MKFVLQPTIYRSVSIDVNIKSIGYGKRTVLSDISVSFPDGSFTAVIGRNGSGKSTLARALLSLIPYDGQIRLDGIPAADMTAAERARLISGILQSPRAPHITVLELASYGRSPYGPRARCAEEDAIVEKSLRRASIFELRGAYLDEISGGELKRAYFAMMLSQSVNNMILDEATASMDADYENEFLRLCRELSREGRTVVALMHNLEYAVRYADNILLLDGGGVKFFGSTEALLKTSLIEEVFSLQRATVGDRVFFLGK